MQQFQRTVILLSKTSGRDKSCRILQYFGKFLAEQFKEMKLTDISVKCKALSSNMSMTRKVLRFGRTIGIIITILKLLQQKKENKGVIWAKILMNISSFLYFIVDHVHWLCKISVITDPQIEAWTDYHADALWCFEALFDCIASILEIILIRLSKDQAKQQAKLRDLEIDLFRAFMDLLCAYGFASGKISGKMIGAMGTVSSMIGLMFQWRQAV